MILSSVRLNQVVGPLAPVLSTRLGSDVGLKEVTRWSQRDPLSFLSWDSAARRQELRFSHRLWSNWRGGEIAVRQLTGGSSGTGTPTLGAALGTALPVLTGSAMPPRHPSDRQP